MANVFKRDRNFMAIRMRCRGGSLAEIGDALATELHEPPLSRQRVQSIIDDTLEKLIAAWDKVEEEKLCR